MKYSFLPGQVHRYQKDEILFFEGETCSSVGFLLKGELLINSNSFMGKEIIYKKLKEGDFFGNNLIFSLNPFFRGDVKAVVDSEVVLLSKQEFLGKLSQDKVFLEDYLIYQAKEGRDMNEKIKLLSFDGAEERFLYYLANHNPLTYRTVTALAKELQLSREVLSRLLHRLVKEGKIAVDENHKTIIKSK